MSFELVDIIGYVASVLVAVSLMMKRLWTLRWLNLVGAITFTVYGVMLSAWPIAIVNAFIVVVNVVFLVDMARSKDAFELLQVDHDSRFVERFLKTWRPDIVSWFPHFDWTNYADPWRRALILRNAVPVGMCIYQIEGDVACVEIDYVLASHRDRQNGQFFYSALGRHLQRSGGTTIRARAELKGHRTYLKRLGFTATDETHMEFDLRGAEL